MCVSPPLPLAMETSSGWLDAAARAAHGFDEDEVLAMPLPVMEDSSDDDDGLYARHHARVQPQQPFRFPPPSAEAVHRLLYGARAHAHADRGLSGQQSFFDELRHDDSGEFAIPAGHRVEVRSYDDLSAQRFEALHATPCLIRGVADGEKWRAAEEWASEAAFLAAMGESLQLPITELMPAHGMGKPQKLRLRLHEYRAYAAENVVDFPYYPWERDFDGERAALLDTFSPPRMFAPEHDLFELSAATRQLFPYSCHRFLICGGERTGAVIHQDPKCTAAWNTCLFGLKRWVFLPPSVTAEQMRQLADEASKASAHLSDSDSEDYRQVPPGYWWLDAFPLLKKRGLPMMEAMQRPGDTIYVPPRWWHAVINLPSTPSEALTLCVTQNVLSRSMLLDLVGWGAFRAHLTPEVAVLFAEELRLHQPDTFAALLAQCTADERREIEGFRTHDAHAAADAAGETGQEDGASRLRREVSQRVRASEEARAAFAASGAAGSRASSSFTHLRAAADEISLAQFRAQCVRTRRAAVLSGLRDALSSPPAGYAAAGADTSWWLKLLAEEPSLAGKTVPVLNQGEALAAEGKESRLMRLGELASKLLEGSADGLYMYDVSVRHQLPALLKYVRLPRHITHDYLQRTMRKHVHSHSWPTVFMGAKGTHSTLHMDQWEGHFWMTCLHGSKVWTLFHPDDVHLLYPCWDHGGLYPRFPTLKALRSRPDLYPLFKHARADEFVIGPGDFLFVPGGTPHAVENATNCLAIAGNFVDDSNVDAVVHAMRLLGLRDDALRESADALDEMDLDAEIGMVDELLPVHELVVALDPDV